MHLGGREYPHRVRHPRRGAVGRLPAVEHQQPGRPVLGMAAVPRTARRGLEGVGQGARRRGGHRRRRLPDRPCDVPPAGGAPPAAPPSASGRAWRRPPLGDDVHPVPEGVHQRHEPAVVRHRLHVRRTRARCCSSRSCSKAGSRKLGDALTVAQPGLFWLFLGGFCWVIGDLYQQYAAKYIGIGRGIPLSNTNQLWGLAWGVLVFGEFAGLDGHRPPARRGRVARDDRGRGRDQLRRGADGRAGIVARGDAAGVRPLRPRPEAGGVGAGRGQSAGRALFEARVVGVPGRRDRGRHLRLARDARGAPEYALRHHVGLGPAARSRRWQSSGRGGCSIGGPGSRRGATGGAICLSGPFPDGQA